MSIALRLILIAGTLFFLYLTFTKITKSKVQLADTIFWIMLSFVFILLSIFPEIAIVFSELINIESPVNFVFLLIIFLLLVKQFFMSLKISRLDYEVKRLAQYISLHEKDHRNDDN